MEEDKKRRRSTRRSKGGEDDTASESSTASSAASDKALAGSDNKGAPVADGDKDKPPKEKKKSAGSSEEAGEMISKDKQAQAEQQLATVENVIAHIASNELPPMEAARYILHNSVDLQRVAVLQQLQQYIEPAADDESISVLLRDILLVMPTHSAEVQLAAVTGVTKLLSRLPASTLIALRKWLVPMVSTTPATPALDGWKLLFYDVVVLLPKDGLDDVMVQQVIPLARTDSSEEEKLFGLHLLSRVLSVCPDAGMRGMEVHIALSDDESVKVRLAVAQHIKNLVPCIPAVALRERMMMPLLRMMVDPDCAVSGATFEAVIDMTEGVGPEFRKLFLCPILRYYATNPPNGIIQHVVKNYGRLVFVLKDVFQPLSANISKRVADVKDVSLEKSTAKQIRASGSRSTFGSPTHSRGATGRSRSPQTDSLAVGFGGLMAMSFDTAESEWIFFVTEFVKHCQSREADIRGACAFNLPGVAASVPSELRPQVMQCAQLLAKDALATIRATIAAGLHELCPYTTDPANQLLPLIPLLLGDADITVKEKLARNMTVLFRAVKSALQKADKCEAFFNSVTPLVIAYEKDIKRNWRKVAVLVLHMQNFREWFTPADLFQKYVPLLVGHLTEGAAALNAQICKTITLFLREFKTNDDCLKVLVAVRNMIASLAKSKSAAGRIGYVVLVAEALRSFSQEFVKAALLPAFIPLAIDRIVNVRCNVARVLPFMAKFPLIAPGIKSTTESIRKDTDPDVTNTFDEGVVIAQDFVFSAERNKQLLAEEGNYLLSAENVKRAAEHVEKPAAPDPKAAALAAAKKPPAAPDATRRR